LENFEITKIEFATIIFVFLNDFIKYKNEKNVFFPLIFNSICYQNLKALNLSITKNLSQKESKSIDLFLSCATKF